MARVVISGAGQPGAEDVGQANWIGRVSVEDHNFVQALRQDLDAGEAEAIALALAIGADLLLMDERLGRETAFHFGLRCFGLVGVLVEAKHKGLIPSVKTRLDAMRDMSGFRLSSALYARVLRDQGERT